MTTVTLPIRTKDSARLFAVQRGTLWQPIVGVHLYGTYYEHTMGRLVEATVALDMMLNTNRGTP